MTQHSNFSQVWETLLRHGAAAAQEAATMCNRDAPRYLASPEAMEDLKQLNAQFIENFVRNDVAAHDACLLYTSRCV